MRRLFTWHGPSKPSPAADVAMILGTVLVLGCLGSDRTTAPRASAEVAPKTLAVAPASATKDGGPTNGKKNEREGSGRTEAAPCVPPEPVTFIERSVWRAGPPTGVYTAHTPVRISVHHQGVVFSRRNDAPSRLRTMQRFHQGPKRGFVDIAYHYVIDRLGRVYAGRPTSVAGETRTDYDPRGHLLICLMGDFDVQIPTPEQIEALVALTAHAAFIFNIDPQTIRGHRDHAHTSCPGANLYRLIDSGDLRKRVEGLLSDCRAIRDRTP